MYIDWDKIQDIENCNVIVVTHGITLRLFLMRWYQYTVDEFELTKNPPNGMVYTYINEYYSLLYSIKPYF